MQDKQDTENIAENLIKAFVQFRRMRVNESPKFNQNPPQNCPKHSEIMLLFELKEVENQYPDGVSVSDLSRSMRVKPPAITPIITGLEQRKMIERSMDAYDRRIIRVKMTEEGNRFIENNKQHMVTQIRGLVDYLGNEKSATLAELLNEVYAYFISLPPEEKQS